MAFLIRKGGEDLVDLFENRMTAFFVWTEFSTVGRQCPCFGRIKPAETSIEQIGTWMSGKFGEKADSAPAPATLQLETAHAPA